MWPVGLVCHSLVCTWGWGREVKGVRLFLFLITNCLRDIKTQNNPFLFSQMIKANGKQKGYRCCWFVCWSVMPSSRVIRKTTGILHALCAKPRTVCQASMRSTIPSWWKGAGYSENSLSMKPIIVILNTSLHTTGYNFWPQYIYQRFVHT